MGYRYTTIHFEAVKHHTERAVLLVVDGGEVWIPKSCIYNDYGMDVGEALTAMGIGELDVATWFVEEELDMEC